MQVSNSIAAKNGLHGASLDLTCLPISDPVLSQFEIGTTNLPLADIMGAHQVYVLTIYSEIIIYLNN